MAAEGRRSLPDLTARLAAEPGRFDFAQAVRVAEDAGVASEPQALAPVGSDETPSDEAVRFRAAASLAFAAAPIRAAQREESGRMQLEVTFLGLTGPSGVLPQHYTELEIRRLQRRDPALAAFLDLLHHRSVSLFARAATKYRVAHSHERAWRRREPWEPFERVLRSIVGSGLERRGDAATPVDRIRVAYAASFARSSRSAVALEQLLSAFLGLPVRIEPFVGRWADIPPGARSRLPGRGAPGGLNTALGSGAVLGSRYWDVASRIRVEVGPMSRERFLELRPDRPLLGTVRAILDAYCDGRFDFEVALTLEPGASLQTQLARDAAVEPRLGWNTRLSATAPDRAQARVLFSPASP